MFKLVETLPGLRIANKAELDEYRRLIGNSYGPHTLRKQWISICVAKEYPNVTDYYFPLVDEPGNDLAVFSAAVLCVLRAWDGGLKVFINCQQGRSRSVSVAVAALAIRHKTEFAFALSMLQTVYPKANPCAALRKLGDRCVRSWR